jgi:hypothetical protein
VAKEKQQFIEAMKTGEQGAGIVEAIKDSVQAVAPGLTFSNIISDIGAELGRLGVQGQMEMASAIFSGSAFVPYGPGQYTPESPAPEPGKAPIEAPQQPEVQQERGGMEM